MPSKQNQTLLVLSSQDAKSSFNGVAPFKKMGQLINDRKEQAHIPVEQFKSTCIDHSFTLKTVRVVFKRLFLTQSGTNILPSSLFHCTYTERPYNLFIKIQNTGQMLLPPELPGWFKITTKYFLCIDKFRAF